MGLDNEKGQSMVTIQPRRTNSDESTAPSLKSPRTARFAEATSVNSPVDPIKSPFDQPLKTSEYYVPQAQPSDVGFGYIGDRQSQNSNHLSVNMPITPRSPLKSALRSPGAAPRSIRQNPLSPTWLEEEKLEEEEEKTEKQQAKDLVSHSIHTFQLNLLTNSRKSKSACAWQRWPSAAQTSPVVLSYSPCSPPPSKSSMKPAPFHLGTVCHHGPSARRNGRRSSFSQSHASLYSCL